MTASRGPATCLYCGAQMPAGADPCPACGKAFGATQAPSSTSYAAPALAPETPIAGSAPPVPGPDNTQPQGYGQPPTYSPPQGYGSVPGYPAGSGFAPSLAHRNTLPIIVGLGFIGLVIVIIAGALVVGGVGGSRATPSPAPPFTIHDPAFAATTDDDCPNAITMITGISGTWPNLKVQGVIYYENGKQQFLCYGATHSWHGTVTYAGYTFASDATEPLWFKVVRGQGYVYDSGKGRVTLPDRTVVTLGSDERSPSPQPS